MEGVNSQIPEEKSVVDSALELTDEEMARKYWETRLSGEERIATPQDPNCGFCIVVPVYNEKLERIMKQIDSLRAQEGVPQESFEVIYIVNNGNLDASEQSVQIRSNNQAVINLIRNLSEPNIFVVDKSSLGHEISDCNVGRARNRGVAEASRRFFENNKNGVIVQTDADTYFEDKEYFQKLSIATRDDSVVGIAGGIIFEFSPDTDDQDKIRVLKEKVKRFVLLKKWDILKRFVLNPNNVPATANDTFSGAHMISRSFESAVIGGLADLSKGEDPKFGNDLKKYAEANNKTVVGMKSALKVVTALRESNRTPSGFWKSFEEMDINQPTFVRDPFKLNLGKPAKVELTEQSYLELEQKVLNMPNGVEIVNNLNEIVQDIRITE